MDPVVPGQAAPAAASGVPAVFAPGQILSARVIEAVAANTYLVAVRGMTLIAASDSPLAADSVVRLVVQGAGGDGPVRVALAPVAEAPAASAPASPGAAADDPATIAARLGLPPGPLSEQVVAAFQRQGAPLRPEVLRQAVRLLSAAAAQQTEGGEPLPGRPEDLAELVESLSREAVAGRPGGARQPSAANAQRAPSPSGPTMAPGDAEGGPIAEGLESPASRRGLPAVRGSLHPEVAAASPRKPQPQAAAPMPPSPAPGSPVAARPAPAGAPPSPFVPPARESAASAPPRPITGSAAKAPPAIPVEARHGLALEPAPSTLRAPGPLPVGVPVPVPTPRIALSSPVVIDHADPPPARTSQAIATSPPVAERNPHAPVPVPVPEKSSGLRPAPAEPGIGVRPAAALPAGVQTTAQLPAPPVERGDAPARAPRSLTPGHATPAAVRSAAPIAPVVAGQAPSVRSPVGVGPVDGRSAPPEQGTAGEPVEAGATASPAPHPGMGPKPSRMAPTPAPVAVPLRTAPPATPATPAPAGLAADASPGEPVEQADSIAVPAASRPLEENEVPAQRSLRAAPTARPEGAMPSRAAAVPAARAASDPPEVRVPSTRFQRTWASAAPVLSPAAVRAVADLPPRVAMEAVARLAASPLPVVPATIPLAARAVSTDLPRVAALLSERSDPAGPLPARSQVDPAQVGPAAAIHAALRLAGVRSATSGATEDAFGDTILLHRLVRLAAGLAPRPAGSAEGAAQGAAATADHPEPTPPGAAVSARGMPLQQAAQDDARPRTATAGSAPVADAPRPADAATVAVREVVAQDLLPPKDLTDYDRVLALPLADHGQPVPARLAVTTRRTATGGLACWMRVDCELSRLGPVSVRLGSVDAGPVAITLFTTPAAGAALAAGLPALGEDLRALGVDAALRVVEEQP